MNKVILTGRLVSDDFKIFKTKKGSSLTFKIALIENSKNTNFVEVLCFDKLVDSVTKYINKGDLLEIEGKLNNSNYISKNGEKIYKTDILAKKITFSVKAKTKDTKEDKAEEIDDIYSIDLDDDDDEE